MKPLFHAQLVNGPFDDPILYVGCMFQKRSLLFDLGDIRKLSSRNILKISHVFVTHMHMDHFIGFDHLIRLLLGRDHSLSLYGPPGIIDAARGRLSGYSWNLVENYQYPFLLKVFEIHDGFLLGVELLCRKKFAPQSPPKKIPISDNVIYREDQFMVKAVALDHKIPSMAYMLKERFHLNVNKEKLKHKGLKVGSWINNLKETIYANKPNSYMIKVPVKDNVKEFSSGDLREEILITTEGQKIGYIVDCDYTSENQKKIVDLMNEVDVLFIEASFLDEDKERARTTAHLTAREAGELSLRAKVKKMEIFHFSAKYTPNPDFLIDEAQKAYEGKFS